MGGEGLRLSTDMGIHQQQSVVVLAEGGRADVAHQQRHTLARPLGRGVLQQVVAFGSKTDAEQITHQRMLRLRHGGQDVGVLNKVQHRHLARAVFFDFLFGSGGRAPIGHSSSCYKNTSCLRPLNNGFKHILC